MARGLSCEAGLLVVIDGAKALATGVAKVFGEKAVVQRCTLHKRRNVRAHLPAELGDKVDRRLALGWLWRTSCSESTRWQAMRSAGAISRRGWHSLDQLIFKPCLSMPSTRGCRTRRSIGPQPLIGVGRIGARHDRVLEVFGTLPARSATSSAKILGSSPPVIGRRVA